ncbi:NADPH-dependent F420 reductase [Archaeoglobus profundus]|uniref:NADPH-dependent F420 reductase n=1 Tax=Archaeoglobus profundus (strain DSM 5631 / JCM 9629 / NBRC 100127 / Av18) TaxID=572546 RepID=D2RGM4_ARCPA|nr:NADPH-dependent F420 reductase [Archaeoglobus profundus]ADB57449.1 NADPH-dependent F420 reductase [Archaeoglobus profundus DSM 5631]
MIISIVGGTGNLGKGLAVRLALAGYKVVVGSRMVEKAEEKAKEYSKLCGCKIEGLSNDKAIDICDVAILTIPWKSALDFVKNYRDSLSKKIVISPIVPMVKEGEFVYKPLNGSMAESIAKILGNKVVSAFQNIPAKRFSNLNETPEFDVIVCGDNEEAKAVVMEIVNSIERLRALDGGPLSNSRIVESLTPFLINLASRNGLKELGVKFV